ncbi:hypothetical protein [Salinigranum sp. GCM10025319]|uniref:hypothetical protein n=1 Tax=Salinigranum sp. GCM10025319 TaxID=3252687 RepID=UPI00360B4CD8
MARGDPLDGQVLILAAAKASVPAERLPTLVDRVQADLGGRLTAYRREYEAVDESPERYVFLVPPEHWEAVGDRLGLTRREREAVRRAHEEQLRRVGTRRERREEFESALDIRSAVVIGVEDGDETESDAANGHETESDAANGDENADASVAVDSRGDGADPA